LKCMSSPRTVSLGKILNATGLRQVADIRILDAAVTAQHQIEIAFEERNNGDDIQQRNCKRW